MTIQPLPFRGANLPSYSFGPPPFPGVHGTNYQIPSPSSLDHFGGLGMNCFFLNVQWERVQAKPGAPLDETYLKRVDDYAVECAKRGLWMVVALRSFAAFYFSSVGGNKYIGNPEVPVHLFAECWAALAARYKGHPNVLFDLMNEPVGGASISTEMWRSAANAAIWAIRAAGYDREIFCCGNGYSGAAAWVNGAWYGTANAVEMLKVADPLRKTIFNVHTYWDSNGSGGYPEGDVSSEDAGVNAAKPVLDWARANGKLLMFGEFGAPNTTKAKTCVTKFLDLLHQNRDVVLGWSWWAAGPWWPASDKLSIEPIAGVAKAQESWLAPYAGAR